MSDPSTTVAVSLRKTVGYTAVRMGTSARSWMFLTTELSGTIGYFEPMAMLPDGLMRFAAVTAATTSSGDMLYARKRSGFRLITMVRALPPNGGGAETPGSVAKSGRTRFSAMSWISPTVRVWLVKTRSPTGTLPASNRITKGGTVPGGMKARARLTYETASDIACDMSVPG